MKPTEPKKTEKPWSFIESSREQIKSQSVPSSPNRKSVKGTNVSKVPSSSSDNLIEIEPKLEDLFKKNDTKLP